MSDAGVWIAGDIAAFGRHETARQRYRRQKADRFRGSQIAPSHPVEPVKCATEGCGHPRLRHDFVELDLSVQCLVAGCDCTEYREATT